MFQSMLEDKKFLNSIVLQNVEKQTILQEESDHKVVWSKTWRKKVVYDAFFYLHFITDIVSAIAFS